MNRKLLIAFILSIFLISSFNALAETNDGENRDDDNNNVNREELKEKQRELQMKLKELKNLQGNKQNSKDDEVMPADKVMQDKKMEEKADKIMERKTDKMMNEKEGSGNERSILEEKLKSERMEIQNKIKDDLLKLKTEARDKLQDLKVVTPEKRKEILDELKSNRDALHDRVMELRKDLIDNAKKARDEFREKIKDVKIRAKIAAGHGKAIRIARHFRLTLERFKHIMGRIESRISELGKDGVDMTSFLARVEDIKNAITETEADIEELKAKYESILGADNPKEIIEEAKNFAREINNKLGQIRDKIKEVIGLIKENNQSVEN